MEISEQTVVDIPEFGCSETVKRKSTMKHGGPIYRPSKVRPKRKEMFDAYRSFLPRWKSIYILSSVVAILVDPLFLYIPVTNQDMKCVGLDQKLKIVTLFLRSAVDLPCMVNIISQILAVRRQVSRWRRRRQSGRVQLVEYALEMAKRISWPYFLIDSLSILPIPQVVILILLTRTTRGSKYLNARKFLNSLVIFQYMPRAFRMYRSCKEANKTTGNENGYAIWLKVYKFILASHVLGALWYYFSIQRAMDCWQYACRSENECEASTFDCGGDHIFKNVTFLNDLCPINTPNSTLFNFGVFLDALQSGTMGSTNFSQKILQCFWWGLRSLSSFGQNLQTSSYAWENLFALCISITGMLLFLIYLHAILQFATRRSEKLLIQNRERRNQEIYTWLSRNGIPEYVKEVIMEIVQQTLESVDVGVDNILSVLPSAHSNFINRQLRLAMLKKVPMLQNIDRKLLKAINEHLLPVSYTKDSCIFQEGEPLDRLFIITHGTVQSYRTDGKSERFGSKLLEKGVSYGSELLYWASNFMRLNELPISTRTVKAVTRTKALTLMASDLEKVGTRFWWHFTKDKELRQFSGNQLDKLLECAVSATQKAFRRRKQAKQKQIILTKKITATHSNFAILRKVPVLQNMDIKLLKAICDHLEPVCYTEDTWIIQEGERLNKMFFITQGTIQTYKSRDGITGSMFLAEGDFYGLEELLNWASTFSSFYDLPISMRTVRSTTRVEAFTLSADDLKSVAIKYWWHFTKNKDLTHFNYSLLEEYAVSSIEKEIRRRRRAKINKNLATMGSISMKSQQVVSKVRRDSPPLPPKQMVLWDQLASRFAL